MRSCNVKGVGGLVRKVSVMKGRHYLEMWTTGILTHLGPTVVEGSTWVIGGDLRHYFEEAFLRVVSVVASYPVERIVTSKDGLFTSAAMACVLKKEKALCGLYIGSAYKNAGPEGYIGIKLIVGSSSTATSNQMDAMYETYKELTGYYYVPDMEFPLNDIASYGFKVNEHYIIVKICDAVKIYADYMETIFDFEKISGLLKGKEDIHREVKILVDCMGAAGGPFAVEVLERRLGCPAESVLNKVPTEEYNYSIMSPKTRPVMVSTLRAERWDAGFCLDSVAERVMMLGMKGFAVSPGDAAALIAAHLHCVPYFQRRGIQGLARSLPLTPAIDRVADDLDVPLYETPVGSENLYSLLDTDLISFYSDETYGFGSAHSGQKDGIWGILVWLSVFSHLKIPIYEMLLKHWKKYGRYFSLRVDYMEIEDLELHVILAKLEQTVADPSSFGVVYGESHRPYVLLSAENFRYKTPKGDFIDKCIFNAVTPKPAEIIKRLDRKDNLLFTYRVSFCNLAKKKKCISILWKVTGEDTLFNILTSLKMARDLPKPVAK